MSKTGINERVIAAVEWILRDAGVSKAEFARSLGVSPSRFSEILGRRMMAGTEIMALLAERYGISSDWLLTGRGEMRQTFTPEDRKFSSDSARENYGGLKMFLRIKYPDIWQEFVRLDED